ncbi:MAG: DUF4349 domain-containing protein [Clostridiales bacterium]|nr:DUF4349 domain-containing protein [Clostridiales bacterium]
MKKIGKVIAVLIAVSMTFIMTACSKGYDGAKMDASVSASAPQYKSSDYDMKNDMPDEGGFVSNTVDGKLTSSSGISVDNSGVSTMEKIIKYVNLNVETQDFDNLINTLKDEITRLGGYDERTEISGNKYNSRNNNRYAYIVARIPKDRLDEFVDIVNDNGNVVNESSSSENVTLEYVDTQSRKKSLEIEQERLFSLLEKTETLDDIVTLESRLSSIRYELQMYETQLRTMDNKVDYSTVTITINEVERMTPTQDKETVFTRIKNGFSKTIYDISEGLKNFFVWFVVNLPYIIIWTAIISLAVLIIRKILRKRNMRERFISTIDNDIKQGDYIEEQRDSE